MPSQTVRLDPEIGALVDVTVAKAGTFRRLPISNANWCDFRGLLDTGANTTCVTPRVVRNVGLSLSGQTEMKSGTQTAIVGSYLADLVIPLGINTEFSSDQVVEDILVTEFPGELAADVLLGLDILSRLVLHFDGPKRTVKISAG